MPEDTFAIRLSGSGGQGMLLAGAILAEAAAIYDGKNVCQTMSYGPEARLGASRSDVIISSKLIESPKASRVDVLLALNQESCDKYFYDLKQGGILLVDSDEVRSLPVMDAYSFPFIQTARAKLGLEIVANVIALGALTAITGVVSREAIAAAVKARAPRGTEEKNIQALQEGFNLAANPIKNW
jgi:2-oxoglutarate ferredoxin oxidoreductase subunit gamma